MKKLLFLLFLSFIPLAQADEDSSKILGSDFSNYVPVSSEEDAYSDESFMYFDAKFVVSAGTGFQAWTGGIGSVFHPAYPNLEVRFAHFLDTRFALEYGFGYLNYAGNVDVANAVNSRSGLVSLQQTRVSIDAKYYLKNTFYSQNEDNTVNTDSPSAFLLIGAELSKYNLVFQRTNESFQFTAPMPCLGAGLDFSLRPRETSLSIEARYYPAAVLFPSFNFSGLLGGGTSIGNAIAFNTVVKFLFD